METQYSTITITIPKVKISHLQKNAFIYEIDVATRWGRWHLQKKYSQFQDLHKHLENKFNDLPEFPSSILSFFMGQNEEQAEQYKETLEGYLRETSLRKDIINTSEYTQFLMLDKHSANMLVAKPKFLHEFEMEERINDEGKVILDYFYHDDFIVFGTGNDNTLERFNSLVANTKFPWEEDQEAQFVLPLGTVECWLKKKDVMLYKRVWARNYPVETRKFIFSISSMTMVVGLADGGVQIFKLIQKPRYIYYEVVKMLTCHEDEISGMHLDEVNLIIYSTSIDGFLNIIDARRAVVLDTIELTPIVALHGDSKNMRLFISLEEGNIEIYQYAFNAKLKKLFTLCPPAGGEIKTLLFDPFRNYFFAGTFETGEIYIFEIGKPGQEKLSKQVGVLKNKEKIIDMIWNYEKMQLLVGTQSGEMFFWNTVKGKQICTFSYDLDMLKAFEDMQMSKCMHIQHKNMIITAGRSRKIKFWEIPTTWRDISSEIEEEKQLEIRRKVQNLYKVREVLKKKQLDSDEDDLKGWHWADSDDSDENQ